MAVAITAAVPLSPNASATAVPPVASAVPRAASVTPPVYAANATHPATTAIRPRPTIMEVQADFFTCLVSSWYVVSASVQ